MLPGYTFVRPLGAGGFADVFLYEQDMPRRVVAVKVLIDDAINPDVLHGFNTEADILARLSTHPSIVTIYHASISADGRPYFVMEYCPDNMGAKYKRGPLSVAETLDAGVRIAGALETAHRSGVMHRDIKPANILITTLGSPALADFGIAAASSELEQTDVLARSVPWSAPEVLQGADAGSVATEVYALGATLYTLLAGRAPYQLPSGEAIPSKQLEERTIKSKYVPTGRSDLPKRLAETLERALDKHPQRRFASVFEFAEELRWAQFELGVPPTSLDVVDPSWASAAAALPPEATAARGPVISTVREDSRRAQRAQTLASSQRQAKLAEDQPTATSSRKGMLIGAGIGAAVVAILAIAYLAFAG